MWELLVTDYSLQGVFRNFCQSCTYRSRSNSTGKHVCAGSIPLWAHVRNKVRRDKVGLTRLSITSWGLCSMSEQGDTFLCAGCLFWRVGKGAGGLVSVAASSVGLVCWWFGRVWARLHQRSPRIYCCCQCLNIYLCLSGNAAFAWGSARGRSCATEIALDTEHHLVCWWQ